MRVSQTPLERKNLEWFGVVSQTIGPGEPELVRVKTDFPNGALIMGYQIHYTLQLLETAGVSRIDSFTGAMVVLEDPSQTSFALVNNSPKVISHFLYYQNVVTAPADAQVILTDTHTLFFNDNNRIALAPGQQVAFVARQFRQASPAPFSLTLSGVVYYKQNSEVNRNIYS